MSTVASVTLAGHPVLYVSEALRKEAELTTKQGRGRDSQATFPQKHPKGIQKASKRHCHRRGNFYLSFAPGDERALAGHGEVLVGDATRRVQDSELDASGMSG